jgi:hypothetical protein
MLPRFINVSEVQSGDRIVLADTHPHHKDSLVIWTVESVRKFEDSPEVWVSGTIDTPKGPRDKPTEIIWGTRVALLIERRCIP